MKKESRKNLKVLSRIIEVLAKIGKVFSIIAIPFIVLAMVVVPPAINNVDIKDNKIVIKGFDEVVTIEEEGKNNANLKVKVGNNVVASENEKEAITTFKNLLGDTSKSKIILTVETALVFALLDIVLSIIILNYTIKLFKNIGNEDTPFTLDNVNYIKKIAYIMIALIIIPIVSSIIIQLMVGHEVNSNFEMFNVVEILFLFVISYIFEYGYELQKNSKKKIYTEEAE